jgi:predicted GIY-YIG superfamily endonuclease
MAMALLDTGCQTGNWISPKIVARLGKQGSVSQEFDAPGAADANGRPVTAAGVIELQWKKHPRDNRLHHTRFFVFADVDQFDILLGAEYIVKENLIGISQDAMAPLVEHEKTKKGKSISASSAGSMVFSEEKLTRVVNIGGKAAIALAKEKQRQEKEALERRRQAAAAQQSSSQTPQQQQGQGQGP